MARWGTDDWERFLTSELEAPTQVAYGRSRGVPVQARPVRLGQPSTWGFEVRLHGMFAEAPGEVRADLARWLRVGRRAKRAADRLDGWIQEALERTPAPSRAQRPPDPRGAHHDLEVLARSLFEDTFAGDFGPLAAPPGLTWGRRGRSQSRRSLRLGSYELETRLVRIHPVLDRGDVPPWFVRFVLMHEILHSVHPPRLEGGRWIHHGPEFRAREQAYSDYRRALRWEEENLPRLIRAARRGSPPVGPPPPAPRFEPGTQLELF